MSMTASDADRLDHLARKLQTFARIHTGDKEARAMATWCYLRSCELRTGSPMPEMQGAWNPVALSTQPTT